MVQRIKVQGGQIVYEASDSTYDIKVDVLGKVNVTKELSIGNDPLASGTITTPINADLNISSGENGDINLQTSGSGNIVLNNAVWPGNIPSPGMYLGASALNTLQYQSFVIGAAGVDNLNQAQLNIAYPNAQPGQMVTGVTVLYQCVGTNQWRILGSSLGFDPVNKAGDTMTGYLVLNADPVQALGAATKQYVDNVASGLNVHSAVRTSTTTTLSSSSGGTVTYDNGSSGVGATLTTTGSFANIGGVAIADGNRILVKDEINQAHNGIYVRTSSTVLTRSTDFDNSPLGEVQAGDFLYVQEGLLSGTSWVVISTGTILIGTTNIVWSQFSGAAPAQAITINDQTGDYTLQLADAYNTLVRITSAIPAVVTIENDGVINMPVGSSVIISWNGAGSVSLAGAVGVTIISPDSLTIGKQYGKIVVIKTASNYWEVEGNLAP